MGNCITLFRWPVWYRGHCAELNPEWYCWMVCAVNYKLAFYLPSGKWNSELSMATGRSLCTVMIRLCIMITHQRVLRGDLICRRHRRQLLRLNKNLWWVIRIPQLQCVVVCLQARTYTSVHTCSVVFFTDIFQVNVLMFFQPLVLNSFQSELISYLSLTTATTSQHVSVVLC